MYRATLYQATVEQLQAVHAMPDEEAIRISADLSQTHTSVLAYYPSRGGDPALGAGDLDIGRTANELHLKVVDKTRPQPYAVAPYCIESERLVVRGIAIWSARPRSESQN